jgi:hypothetical protein
VAGSARSTPARGIAPATRGEPSGKAGVAASAPPAVVKPAPRPASAPGKASPVRSGAAWDITAQRPRGESPWDSSSDDAEVSRAGADEPTVKGFARALTPPTGVKIRRTATPVPLRIGGSDLRTPSDPDIETYLEIEADLPPEAGAKSDLESELARGMASPRDPDDEHESMSITFEDEGRRVIETTTETDAHTLTVTVTEPFSDGDDRQRAITAEDGTEVSGTISIPEDPPAPRRRAKRHSEGWDD